MQKAQKFIEKKILEIKRFYEKASDNNFDAFGVNATIVVSSKIFNIKNKTIHQQIDEFETILSNIAKENELIYDKPYNTFYSSNEMSNCKVNIIYNSEIKPTF